MKYLVSIVPLIFILDQWTKHLVRKHIPFNSKIVVWDGFFNLTYYENPGAAFGLFRDLNYTLRTPFFYGVSALAFLLLIYLYLSTKPEEWRMRIWLSLIAGGAVGNVADRIRFGAVTDFLQVHYKHHYWPSFNVADSAISVGVTLLIMEMLFFSTHSIFFHDKSEPTQAETAEPILTSDSDPPPSIPEEP